MKRIIWRMKYVVRVKRLVKVIFDETNDPTYIFAERGELPTLLHCKKVFQKKYSYDDTIARMTFAIASHDKYVDYKHNNGQQHVRITGDGLKLISSWTYYMNALVGVVGSVVPIVISLIALLVSIIALLLKLK